MKNKVTKEYIDSLTTEDAVLLLVKNHHDSCGWSEERQTRAAQRILSTLTLHQGQNDTQYCPSCACTLCDEYREKNGEA